MADVMSTAERSALMARIRGRGNRSTEQRLAEAFAALRIRGWRRHYPIPGRPDFAFPQLRIAIFVDGCFWHGCPRHFQPPMARAEFWEQKIAGNRRRDRKVDRELRHRGWKVIRIWEHGLRKAHATQTLGVITRAIRNAEKSRLTCVGRDDAGDQPARARSVATSAKSRSRMAVHGAARSTVAARIRLPSIS
jgi:DNA mismatch endonuclease, patch repair protein